MKALAIVGAFGVIGARTDPWLPATLCSVAKLGTRFNTKLRIEKLGLAEFL
jgi:hypothetical protein